MEQIEDMLDVEYDLPSATDQKLFAALFDRFADWADSQGSSLCPRLGMWWRPISSTCILTGLRHKALLML